MNNHNITSWDDAQNEYPYQPSTPDAYVGNPWEANGQRPRTNSLKALEIFIYEATKRLVPLDYWPELAVFRRTVVDVFLTSGVSIYEIYFYQQDARLARSGLRFNDKIFRKCVARCVGFLLDAYRQFHAADGQTTYFLDRKSKKMLFKELDKRYEQIPDGDKSQRREARRLEKAIAADLDEFRACHDTLKELLDDEPTRTFWCLVTTLPHRHLPEWDVTDLHTLIIRDVKKHGELLVKLSEHFGMCGLHPPATKQDIITGMAALGMEV